ncbi:MAG: L,D-transpeptidase [Sulfuricella sp.]|nr:L,D-transpeptidase [Sulfuricella sp.]
MRIRIVVADQTLELFGDQDELIRRYVISTALNGVGEESGSYCTPRGSHIIRAKIGAGQPANSVFVRRRPTGEIYTPELGEAFPGRDWILTRILWLSGCEPGRNRLGSVDTMRRYVYIHGTPDGVELGQPGSKGCVRMRNDDIMNLFEQVAAGVPVEILESAASGQLPATRNPLG